MPCPDFSDACRETFTAPTTVRAALTAPSRGLTGCPSSRAVRRSAPLAWNVLRRGIRRQRKFALDELLGGGFRRDGIRGWRLEVRFLLRPSRRSRSNLRDRPPRPKSGTASLGSGPSLSSTLACSSSGTVPSGHRYLSRTALAGCGETLPSIDGRRTVRCPVPSVACISTALTSAGAAVISRRRVASRDVSLASLRAESHDSGGLGQRITRHLACRLSCEK